MKEHFKPTASMRSTYPWRHRMWVGISGFMTAFGVEALREGCLTSILYFVSHLSLYVALMNLGAEHYRYARYKGAKKVFSHMVERNEKLGWE